MAKAAKKHTPTASKAGASNWQLLKDAYLQLRKYLEPDEAVQRLIILLRQWPLMPCKIRYVNSGGERILPVGVWEDESLSVEIDITGGDYLEIHYTEYFHPSSPDYGPTEFLVLVPTVERELERLSSPAAAAAPPSAPSKESNRTLRRRETKHPWFEICAEIARRCIDPKTQRVEVPTNEAELLEAILQWCSDTLEHGEPARSEVREAVKIICAALRKI
jgi:hypothetical protein